MHNKTGYYLWYGTLLTRLKLEARKHPAIKEILKTPGGVRKGDLLFQAMVKDGKTIGLGVLVYSLRWTPELNFDNLLAPPDAQKDSKRYTVPVDRFFEELGINVVPDFVHFISLGE